MDLNRIYNNPGLEARRLALLRRLQAEEKLRESREGSRSVVRQIDLGFRTFDKQKKTPLSQWIAECAPSLDTKQRTAYRDLLHAMAQIRSSMLFERKHVGAMSRLARFSSFWLRSPAGFAAHSYNAARQFSELSRFLLARWPVPRFFDDAWKEQSSDTQREWFIHVASGGNLRTVAGLPFPLTKMMAHHAMQAPDDVSVVQALRWGQVWALGGSQRIARAIIGTRLRDAQADEAFWLTVVQFFVHSPMLDPHQVGPIVDWIDNQRHAHGVRRIVNGVVVGGEIAQPNLSMKGRTAASVLRQVEAWHRDLNRQRGDRTIAWGSSGIAGYERVEGTPGNQRMIRIDEILNSRDLYAEGRAMHHCVGSYASSCANGRCAIFSLRLDGGAGETRCVTIEVQVASRRIVQARGRFNRAPEPLEVRFIRNWATIAGLAIGCF